MGTEEEKYPLALKKGTVLAGQYIIDKVLGQGGFGITYRAEDHKTGGKVAIKEFFPDTLATRTEATTVMPHSGERGESFKYGIACFLQEAETLAQFVGNESIVKIHTYFEENGTAYFVMDYVEGESFDDYIKRNGGKIPYEDAERILLPIIEALAVVHSKGIVHRDVTPDNIFITKDGKVKLLDFGAARYSIGDKSRSLDVVLKHGFAPKEQYTRHGKQGPFTDVYTVHLSIMRLPVKDPWIPLTGWKWTIWYRRAALEFSFLKRRKKQFLKQWAYNRMNVSRQWENSRKLWLETIHRMQKKRRNQLRPLWNKSRKRIRQEITRLQHRQSKQLRIPRMRHP